MRLVLWLMFAVPGLLLAQQDTARFTNVELVYRSSTHQQKIRGTLVIANADVRFLDQKQEPFLLIHGKDIAVVEANTQAGSSWRKDTIAAGLGESFGGAREQIRIMLNNSTHHPATVVFRIYEKGAARQIATRIRAAISARIDSLIRNTARLVARGDKGDTNAVMPEITGHPRLLFVNPFTTSVTDSIAGAEIGNTVRQEIRTLMGDQVQVLMEEVMKSALGGYWGSDIVLNRRLATRLAQWLQVPMVVTADMTKGKAGTYTVVVRPGYGATVHPVTVVQRRGESLIDFSRRLAKALHPWISDAAKRHRVAASKLTSVDPVPAGTRQPTGVGATSLVFDRVTVVDVEHGTLRPAQRVVIVDNRIRSVGPAARVRIPHGALVVDARRKYLIPGLWDLHVHLALQSDDNPFVPSGYHLLLANGVTGFRDAGTTVPLDTLIRWRREILAGTRVGPPRQLFSSPALMGPCAADEERYRFGWQACVGDSADARRFVDSLKIAGVDMLKMRGLSRELYFVVAAEARRVGVAFSGHASTSAGEAADSGTSIVDHIGGEDRLGDLCYVPGQGANVARCRPVAERFRRHNTWSLINSILMGNDVFYPAVFPQAMRTHVKEFGLKFWAGIPVDPDWLREAARLTPRVSWGYDLSIAERAGLPLIAGTDFGGARALYNGEAGVQPPTGFSLHMELALNVAWGLTPLAALQTATINPAKMWRATDSLGTVAPGKLADLVLLDADPLAEITNTTKIRAVVANGRYFDRAALDQLLAEARLKANK